MIGVLAGTIEGREIIAKLRDYDVSVYGSTATAYGADLIEDYPKLTLRHGAMDQSQMDQWIQKNDLRIIIDATHPYAVEVSKNVAAVCQKQKISLARYERPDLHLQGMRLFADYAACIAFLDQHPGKILLTTGSNHMADFVKGLNPDRLMVRLLPKSEVLKKCEDLGLKANQIIAMQGPFSQDMNMAMIRDYDIAYLVTKDSGKAGGLKEKTEAAIKIGAQVLCIQKSDYSGSQVWESQEKLLKWIGQQL